ncbi:MAG: CopD family protein [Anaerolineae bacterium]|nr:CopD family protein [Anaerolineae bacterium]
MRLLHRLILPVFVVLLAFGIQPVLAHGYIVRAIPEDRTTLEHPPARLQYWFSESLEPRFSSIILRDQTGAALAEGSVDAENPALISLQVPPDLPDGAYIVDLRPAFASDGHVVAETRVFFVGQEVGGVAGSRSGYEVIPLEVLWRTLLLASILLAFGTAVLYAYVLLPAWGNPLYRAGLLPPRVMNRLNLIFGVALAVAVVGNIIAILQQSMSFFSTGLSEVLTQGLWQVVRIGSRFGDVWTARMILLALAGALFALSIQWREERPATVRAFWSANVWVGALLVGAFSVTSHAAGSLMLPWLAVFVDWTHTLAVGIWVGGLAALVLVLPMALRPYRGEARRQALLIVLQRFSRLITYAVALAVATGIYSALNWVYQPSDLTQTSWGGALLVKVVLVAGVLLLGLVHHVAANPDQFERWSARMGQAMHWLLTLRLETALVLAVLISVAYLSASAVPEPVFLTENVSAPTASAVVEDLSVRVTLSPGGPGVNTFDVVVEQAGQAVDVPVRMQVVNPARDWRSPWQDVPQAGTGLYVTSSANIDREGRWLTLLDIGEPGESVQRAAFAWEITQAAAIPTSVDPGPLNWLALVGVLAALGWAVYPSAYRLYKWLDWSPVSVAIGASAIVATAFLIGFAIVMVGQGEAVYDATINPPPAIVNSVLPDSASLSVGRDLFAADCAGWDLQSSLVRSLIDRLPRTRDEELFAMTRDGWRDLPPCSGDLSEAQRWNLVNFIRTLT